MCPEMSRFVPGHIGRTNGDKTGHFGTNWETPPFRIHPHLALLGSWGAILPLSRCARNRCFFLSYFRPQGSPPSLACQKVLVSKRSWCLSAIKMAGKSCRSFMKVPGSGWTEKAIKIGGSLCFLDPADFRGGGSLVVAFQEFVMVAAQQLFGPCLLEGELVRMSP